MLYIRRSPAKDFFNPTANVSGTEPPDTTTRWVAAHNDVWYDLLYHDYAVVKITQHATNAIKVDIIGLEAVTSSNDFIPGSSLFLISAPYYGTYNITLVANHTTAIGIRFWQLVIITAYIGDFATGYGVALTGGVAADYHIIIRLYGKQNALDKQKNRAFDGGITKLLGTARYKPNTDGSLRINIASILQSYLEADDEFDYSTLNRADRNISWNCAVHAQEVYSNHTTQSARIDILGFVNAAMQIGNAYGENMAEYAPYFKGGTQAKFLTRFTKPVYFDGWPFDLSFIYSFIDENAFDGHQEVPRDIKKRETGIDLNGNQIGGTTTHDLLDHTQQGFVNRITLNGGYANNIKCLDVQLKAERASSGGGGSGGTYTLGSLAEATASAQATMESGVVHGDVMSSSPDVGYSFNISELLTVCIDRECHSNPVYLSWLNTLGGRDYWLFHTAQDESLNVFKMEEYEPFIYDIATATGRSEVLNKRARKELTIGANNLTRDQVEGLKDLLTSPKVYEMDKDGNRTLVKVKKGSFRIIDTKECRYDIQLKLEYPELYLQSQ